MSVMQLVKFKETAAAIREAIASAKPFSLIRLGDGEAIILGYPEFYAPERFMKAMRLFFGEHAKEPRQFGALRGLLSAAVANADIIGTTLHQSDDINAARDWLLRPRDSEPDEKRKTSRLSYELLQHLTRDLVAPQARITSKGIHLTLYNSGFLKELLSTLQDVTVITCNDVCGALLALNPALRVAQLCVPGEAGKERERMPEWRQLPPHYPDIYEQITSRLRAGDFQGPVLVGAGPLGKAYCDHVKRAGGAAIDIGSIMDVWAGRVTRGLHDWALAPLPDRDMRWRGSLSHRGERQAFCALIILPPSHSGQHRIWGM